MENPIKMDDLGVPLFLETPTFFQRKCWGVFLKRADFFYSSLVGPGKIRLFCLELELLFLLTDSMRFSRR